MQDCMTCSVTSPLVTRGDENSSPWNLLPHVCKVISPLEKSPYTHTHPHTHYLPVLLRATRRWGQRAQSPLQSGSLGPPLEFTPLGLRTHTPPLSHCQGRE